MYYFLLFLMVELDVRDSKIFDVICDNARVPFTDIAKATKISKDSVKSRIDSLVKKNFILSFTPVIDYNKIGYKMFHAFIKLNTSLDQEELFLKNAISNGNVVAVTKVIGGCDYELQVLARDVIDEYRILDKLFTSFKKGITDLRVLTIINYYKYTMNIKKSSKRSFSKNVIKNKPFKVDSKDLAILKELFDNCRESLVSISEKVDLSPELVRYRIKSLINSGVIKSFHARINKNFLGLTTYLFLLDIEGEINNKDLQFFNSTSNIYHSRNTLGNWNLNIGFCAGNNNELFDTIYKIRKNFGDRLNRFDLLVPLHRYKFSPIPDGLIL